MSKKKRSFKNLRNPLFIFNIMSEGLFILLCFNNYIPKKVQCSSNGSTDLVYTDDLYFDCVELLQYQRCGPEETYESMVCRVIQKHLDKKNYPLRIHSEPCFTKENTSTLDESLRLIFFRFDLKKVKDYMGSIPYISYANQSFLFDPSDNSFKQFGVGPPYCYNVFVRINESKEVNFNRTFAKIPYFLPDSLKISPQINQQITMIPEFVGIKFRIIVIRPNKFENDIFTESLYKKILRNYKNWNCPSLFEFEQVFYFITTDESVILSVENSKFKAIQSTIEKDYGNFDNFLPLLIPYCGDAGGSLLFAIDNRILEAWKILEENNNNSGAYAFQDETKKKSKSRISLYLSNRYHFISQERHHNSSFDMKKHQISEYADNLNNKDTIISAHSTPKNTNYRLNIAINPTFENLKEFRNIIENRYRFMANEYQKNGLLATTYYVKYDNNKFLRLIFRFYRIINDKNYIILQDEIRFLSLMDLSSQTGNEMQIKLMNSLKSYIQIKNISRIFWDEFKGMKNVFDNQFQIFRQRLIHKYSDELKKFHELLCLLFPKTTKSIDSNEISYHLLSSINYSMEKINSNSMAINKNRKYQENILFILFDFLRKFAYR